MDQGATTERPTVWFADGKRCRFESVVTNGEKLASHRCESFLFENLATTFYSHNCEKLGAAVGSRWRGRASGLH